MREFSLWGAWSLGVRFFSGAALGHAILLLGIGVALPIALQVMAFGEPAVLLDPESSAAADPVLGPLITLAGYVLQTISFFASWRLGAGRGATFAGALLFGLVAGMMACAGLGLALYLAGYAFGLISVPVAMVAALVAFVALFPIAWTAFAALSAAGVWLMFLLALTMGAAMGDMTYAATIVGGSGVVWTILVAASFVLLWLAARLSCTAMLMAERKSFNVIAAMRESWSLTWDDEWRITRYLAMLGLVVAVLIGVIIALAGAGIAGRLLGEAQAAGETGVAVLLSALAIPLAYLSVLVPAGIYRELAPVDAQAVEVFA